MDTRNPDNSADAHGAELRGAAARPDAAAGAEPSITAPANCIHSLRHGVDSLYVSLMGRIYEGLYDHLVSLKELAKNPDPVEAARAIFEVGDHILQVAPHGRGPFQFVLRDNWFRFEVAGLNAKRVPMVSCQIRSEFITAVGPEAALDAAESIMELFGQPSDDYKLSRIDLFVDFLCAVSPVEAPVEAWISRCRKQHLHLDSGRHTGRSFAPGAAISARIYDKTLEIAQRSHKDYLKPLWAAQGWDGEQTVWRLEFQVRREGMPPPLTGPAHEGLRHLAALWHYLAQDWLRLAVPSATDATRARWPTDPRWQALIDTWTVSPSAPSMARVLKSEAPADAVFFSQGLAGLTGFMAKHGYTDLDEAFKHFLDAMRLFHDDIGANALESRVEARVAHKRRRYYLVGRK